MIAKNPNITIPEMADRLEKSTRAIEKQVAKLKLNGTISRIGADKDGHWVVLDKTE
jgi:ATP-dependent DNA helicase RecG